MAKETRKVKDSMFRALFSNEENARELFVALGNELVEGEKLEIVTLDYALGDMVQNDLALRAGNRFIVLTEAQATFSPNMPVRILEYAARTYEIILNKYDTYREKILKIPAPQLYVLYSGNRKWPDGTMVRLSDMYEENPPENTIEAVVKVINIRYNEGSEVLEKSSILKEYAAFVESYMEKLHQGMTNVAAVGETLREFIAAGSILSGFLKEHENEVDVMLSGITKEEYGDIRYQEGREEGREEGIHKSIRMLRGVGLSDESIVQAVLSEYEMTESEIWEYLK